MSAPRVLVVDDDVELGRLVGDIARDEGHDVMVLSSAAMALAEVERAGADLVLTDVRMPRLGGIELIEKVRAHDPRIVSIAMTAFGSIDTAVQAMRAGAYDYIPKPFRPDDLAMRLRRALERRAMSLELSRLRDEAAGRFSLGGLIGKSAALREIASLVKRVADSTATVLITGPSGSGKEVVARALHGESRRRSGPFVALNCAAIPETLIEAELFGVKKGAFTDARVDRRGLFREAEGGTLFLDEIGELAMPVQAKLLRALQEREVRALGADASEPIDVRIVAATNQSLRAGIEQKVFREDLFYRLAVIEMSVPPLRDRPEDIMPLAIHFLNRSAAEAGKKIDGFTDEAIKRLVSHSWPGNVRELENAVERAAALCEGRLVSLDDLPDSLRAKRAPDYLSAAAERGMTLEELGRAYAELVLARHGGNKQRAAQALGIDRRTLQRWFGDGPDSRDS